MHRRTATALVSLLGVAALSAAAQQSATPAPVKGMASTVGLYVYPRKQQSATQQLTDESQCYNDAKTQTGFDPNATSPAPKGQSQKSGGNDRGAAKGAMRGAVVSGATGGDAAAGARRGAIIGGVRSKRKEKQASEQADKQTEANKTQGQQQQDDFRRSLSACLDARAYSVK